MGVHEFCLLRGVRYGSPESMDAMRPFAEAYERALRHAHRWQDYFGLSRSVAATAIAPTGTIGIVGETTTGIEPIFAAAYERTVIDASPDGDVQRVEYVVDPTARRLVESGVDPELIEDAYSLSYDYERRFAMQHFWQRYTDHGISSTVNLPRVVRDEDEQHEFGDILMRYLPELRGITCYPDGARPRPASGGRSHRGRAGLRRLRRRGGRGEVRGRSLRDLIGFVVQVQSELPRRPPQGGRCRSGLYASVYGFHLSWLDQHQAPHPLARTP